MKYAMKCTAILLMLSSLLTGCSLEETTSDLYDLVSDDLVSVENAAEEMLQTEESVTRKPKTEKTEESSEEDDSFFNFDWDFFSFGDEEEESSDYSSAESLEAEITITEDGVYTSKEDVALYIHIYEHLPDNFITKKEAEKLGWHGGSLEPYAPGKCIGGSRFGNYEKQLPTASGRTYTECDIDTLGAKSRGAKRIVFSNDGLIYYTADHYETFELLYD